MVEAANSGQHLLSLGFRKLIWSHKSIWHHIRCIFLGLYNLFRTRHLPFSRHVKVTEIPFLGLTLVTLCVGFWPSSPLRGRLLPDEKDGFYFMWIWPEGCSIKIVFDSYIFDPLGSVIGRKTILGKGKIGEGAKGSFESYVHEEVGNWMGKLIK